MIFRLDEDVITLPKLHYRLRSNLNKLPAIATDGQPIIIEMTI